MSKAKDARPDGSGAIAIVTPDHMHAGPTYAFLAAGVHENCDKPLTRDPGPAKTLREAMRVSGRIFTPTPNCAGYPLVRRMREMARGGELGGLQLVQVENPQEGLGGPGEAARDKQATWRVSPPRVRARSATSARAPIISRIT